MTALPPAHQWNRPALSWSLDDIARLSAGPVSRCRPFVGSLGFESLPGLDMWDSWPIAFPDGRPISWRGGELWFALVAPQLDDPETRHFAARIHAVHRMDGKLRDLGPAFPDGFSPGFAEWSGCAIWADGLVSLYFTAVGMRGEPLPDYRQRLLVARAPLLDALEAPFGTWSPPEELLAPGSGPYQAPGGREGGPGTVKAFRDPFPWTEADGSRWLLFTASSSINAGSHDGVIGLGRNSDGERYEAVAPLIDATGLCNELERPHLIAHHGLLYLFWSSQASVFAPGASAPTGLYGACAHGIRGEWKLLNGHGLVFANPVREPFQAYSWWVMPDLSVASFADYCGVDDPAAAMKPKGRGHFAGAMAPFQRIWLEGDRAGLVGGEE